MQHTILIAHADPAARTFLAAQLDADGHAVHEADGRATITAALARQAFDVVLLAAVSEPGAAAGLLRDLRRGALGERVHPRQPVITLGPVDELSTLRAYDAGSDHHLDLDAGYLVLRAALNALLRRTIDEVTSRHLHVGQVHIDIAARTVDVDGRLVRVSRKEFDLLARLAEEPTRVFSKRELMRELWGHHHPAAATRTVDSHACRARSRLREHGQHVIQNVWGQGYRFSPLDGPWLPGPPTRSPAP